jgi:hypothetical protein
LNGDERELIQVCYELNETNKDREFGAFEKVINDLKLKIFIIFTVFNI